MRKGRQPPAWWYERPRLTEAEQFYLDAFDALDSERPSGMGGSGRIPWSAVERYGRAHGLDEFGRETLHRMIGALERATAREESARRRAESAAQQTGSKRKR